MKKCSIILASVLLATSINAIADTPTPLNQQQPLEKIAPYPQAEKGMSRQVIFLEPQKDESRFKVELLIGKTLTLTVTATCSAAIWKPEHYLVGDSIIW